MDMEKATTIGDILKVTIVHPLRGKDFDAFYQDCDLVRGENPAEAMAALLRQRKDMPFKLISTGHGGTVYGCDDRFREPQHRQEHVEVRLRILTPLAVRIE